MTPVELDRVLEKGTLPPLLLLYGEETFLLEKILKRIVHKAIPEDARDFNLTIFHGKECMAGQILDTVRTFPVFCTHRLVIVKDAQSIPAGELDKLLSYLKDPVEESILIFIADKIDARRKFYADFKKYGELIEFKKLYENQVPSAVRDMARQEGVAISEEALALFCRRVSPSLQDIHTEVQKLAAYVGERKVADVSDIDAVVTGSRQETVFALTDAIGQRKGERAISLITNLLDDGTPALVVLTMIVRHLRQLWKIGEMVEQRCSSSEIAKGAGINPYFIEGMIRQSKNFTSPQFRSIFDKLLEADLALKSSGNHPELLLERLIISICDSK